MWRRTARARIRAYSNERVYYMHRDNTQRGCEIFSVLCRNPTSGLGHISRFVIFRARRTRAYTENMAIASIWLQAAPLISRSVVVAVARVYLSLRPEITMTFLDNCVKNDKCLEDIVSLVFLSFSFLSHCAINTYTFYYFL